MRATGSEVQLAELKKELEQSQAALAELKQGVDQYQMIFDSLPIMFWYKDTENVHIRVNKAAAALEDLQPEAIEGKSAYEMYPQEQAAAYHADDKQVISSGKPKLEIVEKHISLKTGDLTWLQTGKVPTRNKDGEVIGVVAFAVDITQQKRAEEALKAAYTELDKHKRHLERAHEFFRTTLEYLQDAVERNTPAVELIDYVKYARGEFERLE